MKKSLPLVIAAALTASVVTGCDNQRRCESADGAVVNDLYCDEGMSGFEWEIDDDPSTVYVPGGTTSRNGHTGTGTKTQPKQKSGSGTGSRFRGR